MAFVINPDGTIKILEVKYDRSGNISPKRIIEGYENTSPQQSKKKKNKHRAAAKISSAYDSPKKDVMGPDNSIKQISSHEEVTPKSNSAEAASKVAVSSPKYVPKTPDKKKLFQTKGAIDEYFIKRKELHQIVHQEILDYAIKHLNGELQSYFVKCFNEHNSYCRSQRWYKEDPEVKQKKTRKESAITPIGKASSGKFGNSRHPVYGYARDKYGRVQERDSLNEERKNEFRQSQALQSRYDYSNYDSENDHDNYYDSNGYD